MRGWEALPKGQEALAEGREDALGTGRTLWGTWRSQGALLKGWKESELSPVGPGGVAWPSRKSKRDQ